MSFASKSSIRKEIKNYIKSLPESTIQSQSYAVYEKIIDFPIYRECKGISVYLTMSKEVDTSLIIKHALQFRKRVFIPKVMGGNPQDMIMTEIKSFEIIESFPKNSWGIPEPTMDYIENNNDNDSSSLGVVSEDLIDLVLVPGVAFDRECGRLGHGKGYYDYFLSRLEKITNEKDKDRIIWKVGLGLNEQIVSYPLPREDHDRPLDYVITPNEILKR